MKEFLEYIVKNLVKETKGVEVICVEGETICIYQIKCPKSQVGKVIGKEGRMIKCIQYIVSGIMGDKGKKIIVEVLG